MTFLFFIFTVISSKHMLRSLSLRKFFSQRYFLLFFLLLCVNCHPSEKQEKPSGKSTGAVRHTRFLKKSSTPVITYKEFRKADSLYKEVQFKEALNEYQRNSHHLSWETKSEKKIYSRIAMAKCHYRMNNQDIAQGMFREILRKSNNILPADHYLRVDLYTFYGKSLGRIEEPDSALFYLKKAAVLERKYEYYGPAKIADIYYGIGSVYRFSLNDYANAESFFMKSRDILENLHNPEKEDLLATYYILASNYRLKKDIEKALNYGFKALSLSKRDENLGEIWEGACYEQLALAYQSKKDYNRAVHFYKRAVSTINHNVNDRRLASFYNNIGGAYYYLKHFDKAKEYYKKALLYSEKFGIKSILTNAHLNLGEVYQTTGEYRAARVSLKRAIFLSKELYGEIHPETSDAYLNYGNLYQALEQYDSALIMYQKVFFCINNFNTFDITINPSANEVVRYGICFTALINKANIFQKKYLNLKEEGHLHNALSCYRLIDRVIDLQKQLYDDDYSEFLLNEGNKEIYISAIDVCHSLYQITGKAQYIQFALSFMEKSKGNVLWKNLKSLEASSKVGIPISILNIESLLKSKLAYYKNRLSQMDTSSSEQSRTDINNRIFDISQKLEKLKKQIAAKSPAYYEIKYASSNLTLPSIQFFAKDNNSAFIEYFKGTNEIFLILIASHKTFFRKIENTSLLEAKLATFESVIKNGRGHAMKDNYRKFTTSSYFLYSQLLKSELIEIQKEKPSLLNLIVVPDENISTIPFEALLSSMPDSSTVDFKTLPYLLDQFNIRYTYSLNIFFKEINKKKSSNTLIAFDYFLKRRNISHKEGYKSISGTVHEVNAIKEIFRRGEYFTGFNATEGNFKANASNADIIHLAIHGIPDTLNPLNSRLIFNKSGKTKEDGVLYFHELYNVKLNSSLVVLSACETAVGQNLKGEGIISLGRAFHYSGASAIVMSLWKINDRAAPAIMQSFYKNLLNENIISGSLSSAKREYLRNADEVTAHPGNWAAFVVVGNINDRVENMKENLTLAIVFLILVIIGAIIFVLKKRQALPVSQPTSSS